MEEERVVLKQQKSSAKFAVCLEFNTQIPRPFGGLLFYTVKGRHTATWAFQRTMYTDTVPMHAAAATLLISSTCPDLRAMRTHLPMQGRWMRGERSCHAVRVQIRNCADRQHTSEPFSLPACFSPISSFHPSEEQSQRLKDSAKVPCYAEERDTLTQLSISFAHLHVCGTLWINYVSRI